MLPNVHFRWIKIITIKTISPTQACNKCMHSLRPAAEHKLHVVGLCRLEIRFKYLRFCVPSGSEDEWVKARSHWMRCGHARARNTPQLPGLSATFCSGMQDRRNVACCCGVLRENSAQIETCSFDSYCPDPHGHTTNYTVSQKKVPP